MYHHLWPLFALKLVLFLFLRMAALVWALVFRWWWLVVKCIISGCRGEQVNIIPGEGGALPRIGGRHPLQWPGRLKELLFLHWTICFVEHLQSIEGRWLISTGQGTTSYWEITEHLSTSLSKPTEVWWCFNPIFHTQILCLLFHLYKSQLCINIKLREAIIREKKIFCEIIS